MKEYKVIAMNLGSTSTKLAYYINDECQFKKSIAHSAEEVAGSKDIWDQYDFRKNAILEFMKENDISQTKVWRINEEILVIAGTIPVAIEIYNTRYPYSTVEKVELVRGKWDCDYALMLDKYED